QAINEITDQGEGTDTSPDQGTFDPNDLAHYYTFAEVYFGNEVAPDGSGYKYSGATITMPTVFTFAPQPPDSPDQQRFIGDFTRLMMQLESCWTSGAAMGAALGTMFALKGEGVALIRAGFTPQFTFR
ncbi:MAG TPA: ferritin-like domain-containing protein, partial [Nitrospira sp.]|nr:ferritin-like domain-containing protein [Nitrospira sp.]